MIRKNFTKEFEVCYYDIDKKGQVSPLAILNYLEECAIAHSQSVGLGIDKLEEDGVAWILNKWTIRIDRYPRRNEKLTVETWPTSFQRFYANRQFFIWDENNNIVVRASSLWIFIDIKKRRPKRISEHFGDVYGLDTCQALDMLLDEIVLDESKPKLVKEFQIRRSDIDTNNHVNNKKYIEWMLETVPNDIYENCRLESFEIQYKKESDYGTGINSFCTSLIQNDEIIHSIVDKETKEELAVAKTVWKVKN